MTALPALRDEVAHQRRAGAEFEALIPERVFERFLTMLRGAVLEAAMSIQGADDESITGLAAALAQQCFINE